MLQSQTTVVHSYNPNEVKQIQKRALAIREDIIKMLVHAKSGHSAGSLGMADIFAALYFHVLKINPQEPKMPDRDRLVLSAGHICPVLYASLAHRGFFKKSELKTLRNINSLLQGHPHNLSTPGVESSSGPLAQGLSQGVGMALACKMDDLPSRIYVIGSDGELNEGQTWEAVMLGAKYNCNNITWIIDRNNIQIDGYTEHVMPLEPLREKLEAFNWHVIEIDGHNIEQILDACEIAKKIYESPTAIIAHTIPGKGVDFMEYKFEWHGKPPKEEQAIMAIRQLRTLEGKIELYD